MARYGTWRRTTTLAVAALLSLGTGMFYGGAAALPAQAAAPGLPAAWGINTYGQLGDSTLSRPKLPVLPNRSLARPVVTLTNVTAMATGANHSLALLSDATVAAWGYGSSGQLGIIASPSTNRFPPALVPGLTGVTAVAAGSSFSLALKADGTVWSWGSNNVGQLGDNTIINHTSPAAVTGLTGITAISAGFQHGLALKGDGSVWAWGSNNYGQLGNNTTVNSPVPVQVVGLGGIGTLNATAISAGVFHDLAIRSDGAVVAWGEDNHGQLGDNQNTVIVQPVPVQVSGLTAPAGISALAAGNGQSLALKSDGTILAWGDNAAGQLGDTTVTARFTPGAVVALAGVSAISTAQDTSLALKSDGSAWAWGSNASGAVGDNTFTSRTTPVPVLGIGGVTALGSGGSGLHALAVVGTFTPALSAAYGIASSPSTWVTGQTQTYSITVTNTGYQTWSAAGASPIKLGVHFANAPGGTATQPWLTDQHFPLSADLAPGASVPVTVAVTSPNTAASLTLEYQMVQEGTVPTWFSQFAYAPAIVSPPSPISLIATPISSSQIGLSWTASSGASSYKIQRSPDGSTGWTQVGTSAAGAFTDSGLVSSTTYYYRVLASANGVDSAPSTVASATTPAFSQAPQGNWVGTYGADGYVLAAWNGSSDLVSMPLSSLVLDNGFRYQWSSSTSAVQALQSPDTLSRRAAGFYDGTQIRLHLTFPGAYTGTLHLYALDWDSTARRETITVNDGSGPRIVDLSSDFSQGAWVSAPITVPAGGSVTVSVTLTAGGNAVLAGIFLGGLASAVPAPSTGVTASSVSSSQIGLGWTASSGASNYKIQRSPDGSTGWTQVGTSTTTAFIDTGLSPSTAYFYRVVANNPGGDSTPSTVVSATTAAGLAYSQAPQGNWVGTYGGEGYALAAWNGNSDLVSTPLSSLVLDNGNRYQWSSSTTAVQALQSPDTLSRRAATFYDATQVRLHLTFPGAYTGALHLYALDEQGGNARRETVTVNDGSGPQTADISSDFSQGAWVSVPITVPAGGSVTVSVTKTAGANSVLSGIFLGGSTPPVPAAPSGATASPMSSSQSALSWTASSGANSYKLQRSPDGSTGWTQVGTSTTTTFTDTGLSPSTAYFYRVVANNPGGDSTPSTMVSVTTAAGLAYSQAPQGNWVGTYGADGYALAAWNGSDLVSMPLSSLVLDNGNRYQWSSSTTALQALQSPDTLSRRAATFYDATQIRLHLTFPGAYTGTLHLYALDEQGGSTRRETITVNDGSGPRTVDISSDFSQGAWVGAPVTVAAGGSVTVSVTATAGANAVLSGIFLR